MFYSFELQMAGVILLSTMTVCGVSLWIKRRKDKKKFAETLEEESVNELKEKCGDDYEDKLA